jgi:PqqD family protein of HPr-rel-A system
VTAARRWRSVDPSLHWYEPPDDTEVVVFSARSGAAHLVSRAVRPLLETLARQPRTVDEIGALLGDAAMAAESVSAVIESLDAAGLIEPIP